MCVLNCIIVNGASHLTEFDQARARSEWPFRSERRIFIAPKAVELYAYAQNERYSWKMRGGLQAFFLVLSHAWTGGCRKRASFCRASVLMLPVTGEMFTWIIGFSLLDEDTKTLRQVASYFRVGLDVGKSIHCIHG